MQNANTETSNTTTANIETSQYQFVEHFKVRDYECDLQKIVNNAVYQNYLEHARHEFLTAHDVSFAQLAEQGLNLVVTRAEVDYKHSLVSGDEFFVSVDFSMHDRVRFRFDQRIIRKSDNRLCVTAVVFGTGAQANGRPGVPKEIVQKLSK